MLCWTSRAHSDARDSGILAFRPEAVVTTVLRVLTRPARKHTRALVTGVALLVVLSFPVTTRSEPDLPVLPSYGVASAPRDASADPGDGSERAGPAGAVRVSVGPPPATCDQRWTLRDMPDAVPVCALRLAAWDQPWWPLPAPVPEPVPEQAAAEELPPTRAPPSTARTGI